MADGYDKLHRRSEAWADDKAGRFADRPKRTGARLLVGAVALFVAIACLWGAASWLLGWGDEAKRITGPDNVREQQTAIIGDWQGMQAAAANACQAKDSKKEDGDPSIIESPSLAYDAQYRKIAVDYNRRQNNLFEGKSVGPSGYPSTAPTLAEMQRKVC